MLNRLPPLHRYTMLAGLLIILAGLLPVLAPSDFDLWWHLRTGQLIAEQGVPTVNDYSYTELGRPWIAYHWLIEWLMYGVQQLFGYPGLIILFGLVQAGSSLLVYRLLRLLGAGRVLTLLLLLLFAILTVPTWGVRPQILASLFLAAYYLILLTYKHTPSRRWLLWLLLPLSVLWTNMHGTYITGLILIGIFLLGEVLNNFIYRPEQPLPTLPLLLALLGSTAATLLNPYFVNLWLLPLGYVPNGSHNPLFYVDEWVSPDFHNYANLPLVASFVLLMLVGITRSVAVAARTRWRLGLTRYLDLTELGIVVAFTWLGLQGAYTTPLYAVMVLPLLGRGLAQTWPLLGREGEEAAPAGEGQFNWLLGTVSLLLIAGLILTAPGAQTQREARLDGTFPYPAAAATYLSQLPSDTRLFNDFGWGGYLIYRLYPQHRVFIDGRVDVYRGAVFDDYISITSLAPNWPALLDRYKVNTVLLPRSSALAAALGKEAGWRKGYADDLAVVFQKK